MKIPAVCYDCETIFPSKVRMKDVVNVPFAIKESNICPNCDGRGYIPDGTFNVLDNVIESLESDYRDVADLKKASALLRQLSSKEITVIEMEKELKEELFAFASVLNLLPKTQQEKNRDLKFFMKATNAIVDVMIAERKNRQAVDIRMEQIIDKIYENEASERV